MNARHRFLHGRFGSRVLRVSYVISTPPKLENAPSIAPYPPKLAGNHQPSPLQAAILEQDPNALIGGWKLPSRSPGEQFREADLRAGEHTLVEEIGCTDGLPPIRSPRAQTYFHASTRKPKSPHPDCYSSKSFPLSPSPLQASRQPLGKFKNGFGGNTWEINGY